MAAIRTEYIDEMVVYVAGDGPALVFLHGYTTTSEFWREQIKEFVKHFTVILINLPGHGISSSPTNRSYTIEQFTNDVINVLNRLLIKRAALVGLSMGGTIAQSLALKHPERLTRLVLVGATSHGLGEDVNADKVNEAIDQLGVVNASQRIIERSFGPATDIGIIEFAKQEVAHTPEVVAREAIISLNEADYRELLNTLNMPTLIVVGEEDVITPPDESRKLQKYIAESELVVIPSAGHFPMLEQPDEFNQVLRRFLMDRKS